IVAFRRARRLKRPIRM
ncbi:hypothetical protein M3I46_07480, partial [Staphylococcus aureus]